MQPTTTRLNLALMIATFSLFLSCKKPGPPLTQEMMMFLLMQWTVFSTMLVSLLYRTSMLMFCFCLEQNVIHRYWACFLVYLDDHFHLLVPAVAPIYLGYTLHMHDSVKGQHGILHLPTLGEQDNLDGESAISLYILYSAASGYSSNSDFKKKRQYSDLKATP